MAAEWKHAPELILESGPTCCCEISAPLALFAGIPALAAAIVAVIVLNAAFAFG